MHRLLSLVTGLLLANSSHAQAVHPSIPDAELPALIARLDQQHFDAFNHCDIPTLQALYAPDVEFFHDLSGRILNHDQFIQAVQKNICGKVQRRLVEGSLEVYPLAKVGALQMGRHCFAEVGSPTASSRAASPSCGASTAKPGRSPRCSATTTGRWPSRSGQR